MSGSNAPWEEEPEPVEPVEDTSDCPTCGAHVKGKWAMVEVVPLSYGSPREEEPRCFQCAGNSKRIREQLWDALELS